MMKSKIAFFIPGILLVMAVFVSSFRPQQTEPWTPEQLMDPADLAMVISTPNVRQPLVFSVGPAAVIRNSIDVGPASEEAHLKSLRKQLEDIPRDADVVIYCGCCPFSRCPNIRPAFSLLNEMQFTKHKLLNISNNVKTDWIDRGYPVAE